MTPEEISDFTLEQYLLGELPKREQDKIEGLLAQDPGLQARIQRLDHHNQRFLGDHPASVVLKKAEFQPEATPPARNRPLPLPGFALAGLGVAAMVLVLPLVFQNNPGPENRIKGGTGTSRGPSQTLDQASGGISVFLLLGNSSVPLVNGTLAHDKDRIQVALKTVSDEYALLVSIDGTGRVTLHAPDSLKSPLKLATDVPVLLPFAYQLDDAPSFERFVLITGDTPFDPRSVWTEVQAQTNTWLGLHPGVPPVLQLDQGLHLGVFDILKPGKGTR